MGEPAVRVHHSIISGLTDYWYEAHVANEQLNSPGIYSVRRFYRLDAFAICFCLRTV
jgi:hypothetical protein